MTFTDYENLSMSEVADDQAVFDFLQAVYAISPEFSNVWTVNLQTTATIRTGQVMPSLYEIVEVYYNYR